MLKPARSWASFAPCLLWDEPIPTFTAETRENDRYMNEQDEVLRENRMYFRGFSAPCVEIALSAGDFTLAHCVSLC
jgi:hypothetical protein